MGCVRSWGMFDPKPVLRGIEIIGMLANSLCNTPTPMLLDKIFGEERERSCSSSRFQLTCSSGLSADNTGSDGRGGTGLVPVEKAEGEQESEDEGRGRR